MALPVLSPGLISSQGLGLAGSSSFLIVVQGLWPVFGVGVNPGGEGDPGDAEYDALLAKMVKRHRDRFRVFDEEDLTLIVAHLIEVIQ